MIHILCSFMMSEFCNRGGVEFTMGFHTSRCYHPKMCLGLFIARDGAYIRSHCSEPGKAVMDALHPTLWGLCFGSSHTGQWNMAQLTEDPPSERKAWIMSFHNSDGTASSVECGDA